MNQTAANRTADVMHRLDSADLSVHSVAEPVGHQPTGDEPECCNPASATSEANREQEERQLANDLYRHGLPERIQRHWGDGAAAKNKAIKELDDATASLANSACQMLRWREEIIEALTREGHFEALADFDEMLGEVGTRNERQEAYLRTRS